MSISQSYRRRIALEKLARAAREAGAEERDIRQAAAALANTFALGDMLQSLYRAAAGP